MIESTRCQVLRTLYKSLLINLAPDSDWEKGATYSLDCTFWLNPNDRKLVAANDTFFVQIAEFLLFPIWSSPTDVPAITEFSIRTN